MIHSTQSKYAPTKGYFDVIEFESIEKWYENQK